MGFGVDLAAFAAKAEANAHAVVRSVVDKIDEELLYMSPVGDKETWAANIERATRGLPPLPPGYVGGRFRANWQYSHTSPATGTIDAKDTSRDGQATAAKNMAKIPEKAGGMIHYIMNNLPYAQVLEDGHSKNQAPNGMVGLTVIKFQGIVGAAAQAVNK